MDFSGFQARALLGYEAQRQVERWFEEPHVDRDFRGELQGDPQEITARSRPAGLFRRLVTDVGYGWRHALRGTVMK